MRGTRAFTVLDVVLALLILALLAGLIFTSLTPSREQARQAACISNLRQIYAALELYAQDNDWAEALPGLDHLRLIRSHRDLTPYLKSSKIVYCPDTPSDAFEIWSSTYSWPIMSAPVGSPVADMLAEKLRLHGADTPIVVCSIHDEMYYLPREASADSSLLGRFEIQLCAGGHVKKNRVDQPRTYNFTRGE